MAIIDNQNAQGLMDDTWIITRDEVDWGQPSSCGNGTCDPGECDTCPQDCTLNQCCGIEDCNPSIGETCDTCPGDCPTAPGQICCSGTPYNGNCCDNNECTLPQTCNNHICSQGPDICEDIALLMHFDEDSPTAKDSSGNGNDGTVNGAAFTSSGISNGAFSYDGADDFIEVSADDTLSSTSMTLSAWVYIPGSIASGWRTILEHDRGGSNWYGLWKSAAGDMFHFRWGNSGTYSSNFNSGISADTWYHVVGTFDASSNIATLYQNGALDSEITGATSPTEHNGNLRIGINNYDGEPINAIIDEVAIWNRALTSNEVSDLYNSGNPVTCGAASTCGDGTCDPGETCEADICCNGQLYNTGTHVCCSGVIHAGDCCDTNDCLPPETCTNHVCSLGPDICEGIELLMRFDEDSPTAEDSSGNNNDGTLGNSSGTTPIWTSVGKPGGSLDFDGSGDFVKIPADPSLELIGDRTVSAWIYVTSLNGETVYRLIAKGSVPGDGPDEYSIRMCTVWTGCGAQLDKITFHVKNTVLTEFTAESNDALSENQWYHVVGVLRGTTVELWIDGVQQTDTDTLTGTPNTASTPLEIGEDLSNSDGSFYGYIDGVAIWSRALSTSEVQDLYQRETLYCLPQDFHRTDTSSPFGCIDIQELTAFIDSWHYDSTTNPMGEVMEAVGLWNAGTGCS